MAGKVISRLMGVSRDPDDNHILACALAADVAVLVTGDDDLILSEPIWKYADHYPAGVYELAYFGQC